MCATGKPVVLQAVEQARPGNLAGRQIYRCTDSPGLLQCHWLLVRLAAVEALAKAKQPVWTKASEAISSW